MKFILTEKIDAGCQIGSCLYALELEKGSDFSSSTWENIRDTKGKKGFLKGSQYVITWAKGHLLRDKLPSEINESYQFEFKINPQFNYLMPNLLNEIKTTTKGLDSSKLNQIKIIKDFLAKNDFDEIIIATDADSEGEAIARETLFDIANVNPKKIKITRLWVTGSFKSIDAIKKALEKREPYDSPKYNNLADARKARSKGDYIAGLKPKKALVDAYGTMVVTGRIKAFIIGLIGDRELEIKNFIPREFWQIKGFMGNVKLNNFFIEDVYDVDSKGNTTIKKTKMLNYHDVDEKNRVLEETLSKKGKITKLEIKSNLTSNQKSRPLPLSGDDFKSIMMDKYKINIKQAGEILQYLRDEGFTTYQGTNGRHFALSDIEDVKDAYATAKEYFNVNTLKVKSFNTDVAFFDDKKAAKQNHPPLHLTKKVPSLDDLDKWQKSSIPNIKEGYELIAKRIFVHFLEDDLYNSIKIEIDINGHLFEASGEKAIVHGWREFIGLKKVDSYFDIGEKNLGDIVNLDKISATTCFTTVPNLYTERTLLAALMNIGTVIQDKINKTSDPQQKLIYKKCKATLKQAEGIGTDRTRETIIDELINPESSQKSLEKDKKSQLTLNELGWRSYKILPEKSKSFIVTAEWEDALEEIRNGTLEADKFLSDVDSDIEDTIKTILANIDKSLVVHRAIKTKTDLICPLCQNEIIDNGTRFYCSKNVYKNGKQSGCKFSVIKFQKPLKSNFTAGLLRRILAGEILKAKNGNKIQLDLSSPFFTKIIYAENNGTSSSGDGGDSEKLVETPKTFRLGSKFCFKSCFGKELTKAQAEKILKGEEVTLKPVSKKSGKPYKLTVWLEDNGKFGSSVD